MTEYQGEPDETTTTGIDPVNFATLLDLKPPLAPVVIDGVLREAAVATVIGGSKTRKSWLMAMLIAAVLTGGTWLGHRVTQGRVLLLDGELTKGTLFFRLRQVFSMMGVSDDATAGLDVQILRGRTRDIRKAIINVRAKGPGYYRLIIIDPLSCFYPDDPRFSENSNSDMRRVYDSIITLASETRAAVVVVHHLSKGGQSEKSVVDLGSGAGAIARSGDAHIGLRAHKEPGAIVCDMVVREFAENAPSCWQWAYPVFIPTDLNPLDLAGRPPKKEKPPKAVKPEPMTPDEFVRHFLSETPRELAFIQASARPSGISTKATAQAVKEAVATGKAYRWEMGNKAPARYATVPQPAVSAPSSKGELNLVCAPPLAPPHPPERAKARPGKGSGEGRKHKSEQNLNSEN